MAKLTPDRITAVTSSVADLSRDLPLRATDLPSQVADQLEESLKVLEKAAATIRALGIAGRVSGQSVPEAIEDFTSGTPVPFECEVGGAHLVINPQPLMKELTGPSRGAYYSALSKDDVSISDLGTVPPHLYSRSPKLVSDGLTYLLLTGERMENAFQFARAFPPEAMKTALGNFARIAFEGAGLSQLSESDARVTAIIRNILFEDAYEPLKFLATYSKCYPTTATKHLTACTTSFRGNSRFTDEEVTTRISALALADPENGRWFGEVAPNFVTRALEQKYPGKSRSDEAWKMIENTPYESVRRTALVILGKSENLDDIAKLVQYSRRHPELVAECADAADKISLQSVGAQFKLIFARFGPPPERFGRVKALGRRLRNLLSRQDRKAETEDTSSS